MNIIEIFQSFQTQEQALDYLEKVRWHGKPVCPYCKSASVCRHASGDRASQRWQCQDCTRAFSATVGTIFHGTHVPLRNWFLTIGLMFNAKKSASAYQIARDIGMRRPTVWKMMHKVRVAMANDPEQGKLLYGIVDADETYIPGKPRKANTGSSGQGGGNKAHRARATKKTPVVGVVERRSHAVAMPARPGDLSAKALAKFVAQFADTAATILITNQYAGRNHIAPPMQYAVINHSTRYADSLTPKNTIEGFWALAERAWFGQHHHYSKKFISLYIRDACYKYNHRKSATGFDGMVATMLATRA